MKKGKLIALIALGLFAITGIVVVIFFPGMVGLAGKKAEDYAKGSPELLALIAKIKSSPEWTATALRDNPDPELAIYNHAVWFSQNDPWWVANEKPKYS